MASDSRCLKRRLQVRPRASLGDLNAIPVFFLSFSFSNPCLQGALALGCGSSIQEESRTIFLGFVLCCLVGCEEHFNGQIKDLIPKLLQGNPPRLRLRSAATLGAVLRPSEARREKGWGRAAFILRGLTSKVLIFIFFMVTWRHSSGFAAGNRSHISAGPAGRRMGP